MTYIVGLKQPGLNAIISDARKSQIGSDGRWEGENSALKTGLLFPGCIFGRAGDDDHCKEFILRFRNSINGTVHTELACWQQFNRFVELYDFPSFGDNSFQLLLSERSSGVPKLHVLDSSKGLSTATSDHEHYGVTIGSGRDILDPYLNRLVHEELQPLRRALMDEYQLSSDEVAELTPYFLCLWLSEQSTTFESIRLEEYHVGGVFHFVKQTNQSESPQQPAIYVFSAADRGTRAIYSWVTRVAYVKGGLYIETHTPPGQDSNYPDGRVEPTALFDDASRPEIAAMSDAALEEEVRAALNSLPFYGFCGFGVAYPKDRNSRGFIYKPDGKAEDIFDENGRLTPEIFAHVASNFLP